MNLSDYFSLFFFFLFIYFFNLQTTSSRTERSSNFLLNITIGKRNFILYLKKKNKIKLKYRCELDKIENFINEWSNTCNNFIENSFWIPAKRNKQTKSTALFLPRYWKMGRLPDSSSIHDPAWKKREAREKEGVDRWSECWRKWRERGDGLLYKSLAQVTVLARPLRKSIGH